MKEKEDFKNPIDPDKVAEKPGLLEYAHHVGSALIKPEDRGKVTSRALSAMYEQTDLQLVQIKKQVETLIEQAQQIEKRKEVSEQIYQAQFNFEPLVGQMYHLYETPDGVYRLSILGPEEWGRKKPDWEFVSSARLMADHTWELIA